MRSWGRDCLRINSRPSWTIRSTTLGHAPAQQLGRGRAGVDQAMAAGVVERIGLGQFQHGQISSVNVAFRQAFLSAIDPIANCRNILCGLANPVSFRGTASVLTDRDFALSCHHGFVGIDSSFSLLFEDNCMATATMTKASAPTITQTKLLIDNRWTDPIDGGHSTPSTRPPAR